MPKRPRREILQGRTLAAKALITQDHRCTYCCEPITVASMTAEHRKPRSKGGLTVRQNIAAACAPCNQARGNMERGDFLRLIRSRHAPISEPLPILLAWSRRRIFVRSDRACRHLGLMVGLLTPFPHASAGEP